MHWDDVINRIHRIEYASNDIVKESIEDIIEDLKSYENNIKTTWYFGDMAFICMCSGSDELPTSPYAPILDDALLIWTDAHEMRFYKSFQTLIKNYQMAGKQAVGSIFTLPLQECSAVTDWELSETGEFICNTSVQK